MPSEACGAGCTDGLPLWESRESCTGTSSSSFLGINSCICSNPPLSVWKHSLARWGKVPAATAGRLWPRPVL
jgi:hypothetical protein